MRKTDNSSFAAEEELNNFDKCVDTKEFILEYGIIAAAYESAGDTREKKLKKL